MLKSISPILAIATILSAGAANAAETTWQDSIPGSISGSVDFTSDYTSRGMTQNGERPALQGGLTYSIPVNDDVSVYAGAWGSNVDFVDATTEIDWIGGATYKINDLSFDGGIIYYAYPGSKTNLNYDYYEWQLTAAYDFGPVLTRASINYTPQFAGKTGNAEYYKIAFEAPIVENLKATARAGWQSVEDNAKFGFKNYGDWAAGLTYNFKGVDLSVEYDDNSISKSECADGCDPKAVFTITKTF